MNAIDANDKRLGDSLFDGHAGSIAGRYPQITHRLGEFSDCFVGKDKRKIWTGSYVLSLREL